MFGIKHPQEGGGGQNVVDKNSGCHGNLYVPKTYNGKKGKLQIFAFSSEIFEFYF